ncbi:hypothetical protein ACHAWU_006857 [Discostella pseudostelligera]|uniref:Uncharacterized protein n=1 Tax=Discostella pseudostelligera TaxID=259834 RepID=A0ABD3N3H2_9STRA
MRLTGAAAYAAASIVLAATTAVVVAVSADKDVVFAPKMTRTTSRATYTGKLMDAARPTPNSRLLHTSRHLEDDNDLDLSSYSIKFEKCQNVKQYAYQQNDNNNNNDDTVLETKKFVIFRLCPEGGSSSSSSGSSSASASCSSCESNYGEYIVDMDTYLQATVQHKQEEQEQYCEACDECADAAAAANDDAAAAADDDGGGRRHLRSHRLLTNVDCDTCYATCQNIDNMEANGYADASEYIQCEKVYENENKNIVYYAGAVCTNYGTRIKVGLFTDEDCINYDSNAAVDQYIKNQNGYNVKLSYHLLKQTFVSDACVASCAVAAEDGNDDDGNANVAETAEVCQNLYEASGKCESPNGFTSGMSSSSNYEVQLNNEEIVCDYISNIYAGHYDENGEVTADSKGTLTIFGGRKTVKNTTTRISGGQKFTLSFFTIGTIGLVSYALLLRRKLARANKEPFFRS